VETGTKSQSDEEFSLDTASGKESTSIPLTEVHQTIKRKRKYNLERERLIESLVNFSCHTPCAVLEDLVAHELRLWEDHHYANEKPAADDDRSASFSAGSLSSLSLEGEDQSYEHDDQLSDDDMVQSTGSIEHQLLITRPSLPHSRERESALLFVDINGFTKLSTMLDVESFSKVINSYFEMIVTEVISHGGDILKFAGDAFFAEWRVTDENGSQKNPGESNALKLLNASLSSSQDLSGPALQNGPMVCSCVWQASKCAESIVRKFSDYRVVVPGDSTFQSDDGAGPMLNVHCGIGSGHLVGLHVGDYREDDGYEGQEDNTVELRREFLFLGDAINQAS
jgi:class 3 adenylate cyclase